jgi:hypothetical protein
VSSGGLWTRDRAAGKPMGHVETAQDKYPQVVNNKTFHRRLRGAIDNELIDIFDELRG